MGCPCIHMHGQTAYLVLHVSDLLLPPRLLLPDLLLHPCQLSLELLLPVSALCFLQQHSLDTGCNIKDDTSAPALRLAQDGA